MRYNVLLVAALCCLCTGCELATSIDAHVEPMKSVRGYLSFQQNDRLFYEFTTVSAPSADAAQTWIDNFKGAEVDSADIQIVVGDRASTDVFRVVLPDIWYHPINALGQSFVISNDVVRDVRIGSDSLVLFDRTREKDREYPLSYKRGTIGSIVLLGTNIPVNLYGRAITVDRYRIIFDPYQNVVVDIEPGNTIVRTVSVTSYQNDPQFNVRTCYYQRLSQIPTFVISTR